MHRNNKHGQVGVAHFQTFDQLDAAGAGKRNVGDHQVGGFAGDPAQCLIKVCGITTHNKIWFPVNQLAETLAKHRVIIDEVNPAFAAVFGRVMHGRRD